MRSVAKAHQARNLADFEKALKDYKDGVYPSCCSIYNKHWQFSIRAFFWSHHSFASFGSVRRSSPAESSTNRRAVLGGGTWIHCRVRRSGQTKRRDKVSTTDSKHHFEVLTSEHISLDFHRWFSTRSFTVCLTKDEAVCLCTMSRRPMLVIKSILFFACWFWLLHRKCTIARLAPWVKLAK